MVMKDRSNLYDYMYIIVYIIKLHKLNKVYTEWETVKHVIYINTYRYIYTKP